MNRIVVTTELYYVIPNEHLDTNSKTVLIFITSIVLCLTRLNLHPAHQYLKFDRQPTNPVKYEAVNVFENLARLSNYSVSYKTSTSTKLATDCYESRSHL